MRKPKKTIKAWGLMFKHTIGWTFFECDESKAHIKIRKAYWEKRCNNFNYKVIPCKITY